MAVLRDGVQGEGQRTDVFWPLLSVFSGEEGGNSRTEFLFPILHWSREGETTRYAFRPIFDLESDESTTDLDLLWPLFKWRSQPEEQSLDLFRVLPLYDHEVREGFHRLSVSLVFHEKESDYESYLWAWPFYGQSREGPESSTWILPPLFYRKVDEERKRVDLGLPWPLLLVGASTEPGGDYRSFDFLWPLLHYGREGETTTVRALPLFWQKMGPNTTSRVLFPFWWQFDDPEGSFRALFPVYGRQTKGDDFERTFVGGPLFIRTRSGARTATDLLWPFLHHDVRVDTSHFRVFPVLWIRRSDERSYTHLWPLLGYERDRASREYSTLYPFFRYRSDPDAFELNAPWPIVGWEGHPDGHDVWFFPFLHSERSGPRSEGSVLLKLVNWESDDETGTSDFRVLWRLVQSTKGERKNTFVLNPFWRHEENDEGDTYWSVLFGILARKEEKGEVDWRVLWIF